jgi:DNA-binding transcriptional LysR family regulator
MKLEDVRAFVAVVDTGSVGQAARRLNITQPAVTRRVQRLEETLDVQLLDRESKPARPTRAGEAAYRRCLAVLRATDALTRETRQDTPTGPLRVGISMGIAESVLAPALEALQARSPKIKLRLTTGYSADLRKRMAEGALDAAIVMSRPDRPIEDHDALQLGTERLVVIAGRGTALPPHRGLADLAGMSWVLNPDGCGFRNELDRALAAAGHTLEIAAEAMGTTLQIALVARGAGLGLVPERPFRDSPQERHLRVLKLDDFAPRLDIWLLRANDLGPYGAPVDVLGATVRELICAVPPHRPAKTAG